MEDLNNAKVTIGLHNILSVPVAYIQPSVPSITAQRTLCFEGDHMGQCFVVVGLKDGMCIVRRPDDKKRKKDLISIPLSTLITFV